MNVVARAVLNSVLEVRAGLREAGYVPGVVIPAMLAALGLADASVPTLGD